MAAFPVRAYHVPLLGWFIIRSGPGGGSPLDGPFREKPDVRRWWAARQQALDSRSRRNPMAKHRTSKTRKANGQFKKGHGAIRRSTRRRR